MNVTDNYMIQQMQTMAASMSGVPQTGNSKENGSFQDMMDQVGSKTNETAADTKDAKDAKEPVKEKADAGQPEKTPVQTEDKKEELKPEQLAANPNAVNILDLFRPDVVQPAEEPVIEVPVDAIAEESVEGPELALDGQLPEMETGVEANVDANVSMEQQPEEFQNTMKEIPREQPVETAETVEAPKAETAQVENTDKPQVEDAPEIRVEVKDDDEPKAEATETQQPLFHEVKSAPVKVGETYETVDTQQPDMEQKLTDVIQEAVQNGAQRIEIHLAPQALGSLTIEMTKDAGGALQVVFHASSAKAEGLLNQHLDNLQMALRGSNQEEVRIEVQRGDQAEQQHFRQADPDGRGRQQNQRQHQERHEEEHTGDAFMQKLRLGLFE